MQQPQSKPPELLQAQLATFASEKISNVYDNEFVFKNIGSLSTAAASDILRTTTSLELHHSADNQPSVKLLPGTVHTVATKEAYTDFLRSVGGAGYEPIKTRADLLQAYKQFANAVVERRWSLGDISAYADHPEFLGQGTNSSVFTIQNDAGTYAVRIPKGSEPKPTTIDHHIAGAVLGKGVPHLEQVVAASYETGVTVSEIMPGKDFDRLGIEDIRAVTEAQLSDLVDALIAAYNRGIRIDPKASNFLYDRVEGFGIVDYSAASANNDWGEGTFVAWTATSLNNIAEFGKEEAIVKTPIYYSNGVELLMAKAEVLEKYRKVVAGKLSGDVLAKTLRSIDDVIVRCDKMINNYKNPEWVSQQIQKQIESEEIRKKNAGKSPIDAWMKLEAV